MLTTAAIIIAVVLVVVARFALDGVFWSAARDMLRSWPEARQEVIADGGWARFSRRFGLPYAIGLIVGGFAWVVMGVKLVPNTDLGVWLLFGPSLGMMFVGISLGVLRAVRWVVDL